MEALSSQLQDRVVALLNELRDKVCHKIYSRKTVESARDENGMKFTVGELRGTTYYNDKPMQGLTSDVCGGYGFFSLTSSSTQGGFKHYSKINFCDTIHSGTMHK